MGKKALVKNSAVALLVGIVILFQSVNAYADPRGKDRRKPREHASHMIRKDKRHDCECMPQVVKKDRFSRYHRQDYNRIRRVHFPTRTFFRYKKDGFSISIVSPIVWKMISSSPCRHTRGHKRVIVGRR